MEREQVTRRAAPAAAARALTAPEGEAGRPASIRVPFGTPREADVWASAHGADRHVVLPVHAVAPRAEG
jgi:hypothetical protein